jgi:acetylornithine/succinyldiaminopimelate/putrescine aminotransferase
MIQAVRGDGLMWGIDLDRPAAPVVDAALQLGLLVNRTSNTVVRLLPPFVITRDEVDEGVELLDRALAAACPSA